MRKIKAYTRYNEKYNIRYYKYFDIVADLPKVGDEYNQEEEFVIEIKKVALDSEQGNDEVYNYDYYEVITKYTNIDDEIDMRSYYVAIER